MQEINNKKIYFKITVIIILSILCCLTIKIISDGIIKIKSKQYKDEIIKEISFLNDEDINYEFSISIENFEYILVCKSVDEYTAKEYGIAIIGIEVNRINNKIKRVYGGIGTEKSHELINNIYINIKDKMTQDALVQFKEKYSYIR